MFLEKFQSKKEYCCLKDRGDANVLKALCPLDVLQYFAFQIFQSKSAKQLRQKLKNKTMQIRVELFFLFSISIFLRSF